MPLSLLLRFTLVFLLGFLAGWFLKRTRISGGKLGASLPVTVRVKMEELHENKWEAVVKEAARALKPYATEIVVANEPEPMLSLKGVTVSLGEIHSTLLSEVTTQRLEIKDHDVFMLYTSLQARGSVEVTVTIHASAGSLVHIEGVQQPIAIGQSGSTTVSVRVSREQLAKGFISARAVKGSLEEDMRIELS